MLRLTRIVKSSKVIVNNNVFRKSLLSSSSSMTSSSMTLSSKRNFITIVNQAEVAYREFLGMNRKRLEPGLRLLLPVFHTIKRVDLRERNFGLTDVHTYTQDGVRVVASGSLFYKVTDPERACFKVQNYENSVYFVGSSATRAVLGRFDYDKITRERGQINVELCKDIGKNIKDWGIECTRFEIQQISPESPEIQRQLDLQMEAERKRRENALHTHAKINTADGERQTAILAAEGNRQAAILAADGERQAAILASQGELEATKNKAEGIRILFEASSSSMSKQIELLTSAFNGDSSKAARFVLEYNRLEQLTKLATSPNKVYFMPNDLQPKMDTFIGNTLSLNEISTSKPT